MEEYLKRLDEYIELKIQYAHKDVMNINEQFLLRQARSKMEIALLLLIKNNTEVNTNTKTVIVDNADELNMLVKDIVNALDTYARDYDYGLPTHDNCLEDQITIVKTLISTYT